MEKKERSPVAVGSSERGGCEEGCGDGGRGKWTALNLLVTFLPLAFPSSFPPSSLTYQDISSHEFLHRSALGACLPRLLGQSAGREEEGEDQVLNR